MIQEVVLHEIMCWGFLDLHLPSNFLSSIFHILPFEKSIPSKISTFFFLWYFPSYDPTLNLSTDLPLQELTGSRHVWNTLIQHPQIIFLLLIFPFLLMVPIHFILPCGFLHHICSAICDFLSTFMATSRLWNLQGKICFIYTPRNYFYIFLNVID